MEIDQTRILAMKPKTLPPDANLLGLARAINTRLPPSAAVNFYRIQHEDGREQVGIVYQAGLRRAIVLTHSGLGEGDADEIVMAVNEWAERQSQESRWTTDPKEAA
jgi:hypothetical protein